MDERVLSLVGRDGVTERVLDCLSLGYKPTTICKKVGISSRQLRQVMVKIEAAMVEGGYNGGGGEHMCGENI